MLSTFVSKSRSYCRSTAATVSSRVAFEFSGQSFSCFPRVYPSEASILSTWASYVASALSFMAAVICRMIDCRTLCLNWPEYCTGAWCLDSWSGGSKFLQSVALLAPSLNIASCQEPVVPLPKLIHGSANTEVVS
jgi:hypothetical protein